MQVIARGRDQLVVDDVGPTRAVEHDALPGSCLGERPLDLELDDVRLGAARDPFGHPNVGRGPRAGIDRRDGDGGERHEARDGGNGLETSYERQTSDVDESVNCYSRSGPQTLVPEGDDAYALDDGTTFTAVRGEVDGADTLTVAYEADLVETWSLVEGRVPEDLVLCDVEEADPAGGDVTLPVEGGPEEGPGGTSMLDPDGPATLPSADPSGDDTSAIAGLWDATGGPEGRVDVRYVRISDDGLWTDHDFRQDDLGGEGNCYFVTPLRLDPETGDAGSGNYGVADGRNFDVVDAGADGTLDLSFAEGGDGEVSWPSVDGVSAADLEPCDAG